MLIFIGAADKLSLTTAEILFPTKNKHRKGIIRKVREALGLK
jgi:hypothetical protein